MGVYKRLVIVEFWNLFCFQSLNYWRSWARGATASHTNLLIHFRACFIIKSVKLCCKFHKVWCTHKMNDRTLSCISPLIRTHAFLKNLDIHLFISWHEWKWALRLRGRVRFLLRLHEGFLTTFVPVTARLEKYLLLIGCEENLLSNVM